MLALVFSTSMTTASSTSVARRAAGDAVHPRMSVSPLVTAATCGRAAAVPTLPIEA